MNGLRETCHCGCDRSSHYYDLAGAGNCLSARCECRYFVDRTKTDSVGRVPMPPNTCVCGHGKYDHLHEYTWGGAHVATDCKRGGCLCSSYRATT